MAVPARRTSTTRKRKRRSHHALKNPSFTNCTNCGVIAKSHRACSKCHTYKGISVLSKKTVINNKQTTESK